MKSLGLGENDLPMIYLTDANTQLPIPYKGKLEQNEIRKWAQDILKEAQDEGPKPIGSQHKAALIADDSLIPMLRVARI